MVVADAIDRRARNRDVQWRESGEPYPREHLAVTPPPQLSKPYGRAPRWDPGAPERPL